MRAAPGPLQVEAACKKLWTAVHGSEKYIKALVRCLPWFWKQVSFTARMRSRDCTRKSLESATRQRVVHATTKVLQLLHAGTVVACRLSLPS